MTEVQSSNYDNKYQWVKLPIGSRMEHSYFSFLLFSIGTVNMWWSSKNLHEPLLILRIIT